MRIQGLRDRFVNRDSVVALCAMLLLSIFITACGEVPTESSAQPRGQRVTGEEIYRGIFFGQGTVAARVPELGPTLAWRASLDDAQRAALDGFVDALVLAIQQTEPTFFDAFAEAMQGGDHARISRVVDRANQVTIAALDRIPEVADWRTRLAESQEAVQTELIRLHNAGKLSQNQLETARAQLTLLLAADAEAQLETTQLERGWALAVVIALAAAVVYPPAVLAVALAVVVAYAWVWTPAAVVDNGSTLRRDQIIDALAVRLAVDPHRVR